MQLADRKAREDALNIHHSYIVQAPAGSGKTALLTQRFLSLLSTVNHPQEIIALTFTKKAASEMRSRIITSLQRAKKGPPEEAYLLKTYELPLKVLNHDAEQEWDLINKPSQLRIQTIDSLCHYITSRMPLLSKSIPYSQISEDSTMLYRKAASRCIQTALSNNQYKQAAMIFLNHLGNHRERIIDLLSLMLSKRDQWLYPVVQAKQLPKRHFEETLSLLKQEYLTDIKTFFELTHQENLNRILCYRATFIKEDEALNALPLEENECLFWQTVSQLLLTSQGEWRKRYTIKEGFPAQSHFKTAPEKDQAKAIKSTLNELIAFLETTPSLKKKLYLFSLLPTKLFSHNQWDMLDAMFKLLPLLVAELQLVFSEHTTTDFIEIALQANTCLGEENPTDLTLYLDNQVRHLLIDEFQDTSISQFTLIERLIHGWEKNDGRTLFIVGDPMQSIYRFRQADVSLFLKAQKEGIGPVTLRSLKLSSNFRSNAKIISWVNQTCHHIFPSQESMEMGAIPYSASVSEKTSGSAEIKGFEAKDQAIEAEHIANIIQNHPNDAIAILVSSRRQLQKLIPILKQHKINMQGVDLQPLSETPLIETLTALTFFLLNPDDKHAFATLLLSPLCGIDYTSLETLFSQTTPYTFIAEIQTLPIKDIDNDTVTRIKHICDILTYHIHFKYRKSFYEWVKDCFSDLSGEEIINTQEEDINQFWEILYGLSLPLDESQFKRQINRLYAQNKTEAKVQIMTIHKSKGLEFDIVILPSLNYQGQNNQVPLLEWMDFLDSSHQRHLLFSPIKSSLEKEDKLSQFIRLLDKEKSLYEKQRLLYVALTRAKTKLFLYSTSLDGKVSDNAFYSMLKNHLNFEPIKIDKEENKDVIHFQRLPQAHFSTSYVPPLHPKGYPYESKPQNERAQAFGTLIHEILYFMAEHPNQGINSASHTKWLARLRELAYPQKDIQEALVKITKIIKKVLNCPIGQWILSSHPSAHNEYAISTQNADYVIDRTFIDKDVQWIIDYKTSAYTPNIPKHYVDQLENYADILTPLTVHPIKLGLYYPESSRFVKWVPGQLKDQTLLENVALDL